MFNNLGSGCGSKLIEQLRDEYGYKKYIFTQSVAPFKDGELPVQHYNNLLCLSHLQENTDSIGLHQNDEIFSVLDREKSETTTFQTSNVSTKSGLLPFNHSKLSEKSKTSNDHITNNPISFDDINSYIIQSVLSAFYPVEAVSIKSQSIGMEYLELNRLLCSNPNLKILEFYNVNKTEPKTSVLDSGLHKTNPLLKQLLTTFPKYKQHIASPQPETYTSVNSLVVVRGYNDYTGKYLVEELWNDCDTLKKALNPVEWNPSWIDFWHSKSALNEPFQYSANSNKHASKTQKNNSLTIVTNRNKCVDYLQQVLDKSFVKYSVRAYLHWYVKYNIEQDHFEHAFENLRSMIQFYEDFTRN